MKRTNADVGIERIIERRFVSATVWLLAIVLATGFGGTADAADLAFPFPDVCPGGTSEGWDAGVVNGWQGFGGTTLDVVVTGGNPGGYLEVVRDVSAFAMSSQAPWAADYSTGGVRQISVDVKAFGGDGVFGPSFRVRHDSGSNGWSYAFEDAIPNDGVWRSFRVWFDPNWTNGEAEAAGWSLVAGGTEWSFSETMASVDVLIIGAWGITTGEAVGFDNAELSCPIFTDGFELGVTTTWSVTVPSP